MNMMASEFTLSGGFVKHNLLEFAFHPRLGLVWTDGQAVHLSSFHQLDEALSSLQNTKILGKFSDVVRCAWSPYQTAGSSRNYLAIEQKTCTIIWKVANKGNSKDDLEFVKLSTIEHVETGKGCVWHPCKLLLCVFTNKRATLHNVELNESTPLHHGGNITAATWTKDGKTLVLADRDQLVFYDMDENTATLKMQQNYQLFQRSSATVCSMTAISKQLVAIATELPLQKIVMELSADLFSQEHFGNSPNGHQAEKSELSGIYKNRTRVSDCDTRGSHIKKNGTVRTGSHEVLNCSGSANLDPISSKQISSSREEIQINSISTGSGSDRDVCIPGGKADLDPREAMENALQEKKGPIDMNELLSQMRGKRLPVNARNISEENLHQRSQRELESDQRDDVAQRVYVGDEQRECGRNAWDFGVTSERDANGHQRVASVRPSGVVDLTSVKSTESPHVPRFKHSIQPGVESSAQLMLFDVSSKSVVASSPLEGVITPSLILHHQHNDLIIIGSHSRKALSLYHCDGSCLQKLPDECAIELAEAERPIGVCNIPSRPGCILAAVTTSLSNDPALGSILPSSQHTQRKLTFRVIDLQHDPKAKEGESLNNGKVGNKQRTGSTSSPGNDDDSLPPLLLPGGRSLNASENSVGKRLGIEILEQAEHESGDTSSIKKADSRDLLAAQPGGNLIYPSPENADTVELSIWADGDDVSRSFLLQSGFLRLSTIQDVFHLRQVEIYLGGRWIVLTSDKEGFIPLRFTAGSDYNIREATV